MKMIIPALLFLLIALPARSQDFHEWEVFGGFSYFNLNAGSVPLGNGQNFVVQQDSYGWHGSLAENKTSWFGGVIDFSGEYANRVINFGTAQNPANVRFNAEAYPFLFGPRFYHQVSRLTLFGEPLIGGMHLRLNVSSGTTPATETKWAFAFGGGADYQITQRIYFRGQADWIRSHFPETLTRDFQNNYRVSGGIVFKFGSGR